MKPLKVKEACQTRNRPIARIFSMNDSYIKTAYQIPILHIPPLRRFSSQAPLLKKQVRSQVGNERFTASATIQKQTPYSYLFISASLGPNSLSNFSKNALTCSGDR